jgi:hypothetical protein
MSAEPPPSGGNAGFNPDDWTNANDPIDNQFLAANYLQFPLAQGAQTLANTTVSGVLTVQDTSTFADLATFNNGIEIATTAGITFSDTTVQTTAFVEANYAQLNTDNIFLPTFTNTFNGSVDLGTNAIAKTQTSGDSSTFVATTAFVQDAVQVSGVQTTDSPLVWTGVNTSQYNAGGSQSSLTIIKGITNLWNTLPPASGGTGNNVVVSNNGTGATDNSYAIFCVPNNITGADLYTLTPQLTLSNNGTPMQVKDGINIPTGLVYAINGIDILAPYSTTSQMGTAISTALIPYSNTVQMNSAISSATSGLAPINSPTFTGLPLLTTTPTAGVSNAQAVANLQYITNQGFAPLASPVFTGNPTAPTPALGDNSKSIATTEFVLANSDPAPVLTNYAQLTYPDGSYQTFTTPINFSNTLTSNNIAVATVNQVPLLVSDITISIYVNPTVAYQTVLTFNNSPPLQQSITSTYGGATPYVSFFSNPITFNTNNLNPSFLGQPAVYNNPNSVPNMLVLNFSKNPWVGTFPTTYQDWLFGTTGTGLGIYTRIQWKIGPSGEYQLWFGYPYNLGTNSTITWDFASLGTFALQ